MQTEDEVDRRGSLNMNANTITSVLASFNKMQLFRQRKLAMKGNITKLTPLRKFDPTVVTREIERILETTLTGVTYDPNKASAMSLKISETIKTKVKALKFPRYKFIAMVTISSKGSQSITVSSQCVWNAGTDTYATGTYSNGSLLAVATVFAIFQEWIMWYQDVSRKLIINIV